MRQLKLTYPEAEQMFRRMVFNVMAVNYDDHTKNFAFRLKKDEKWELAPAYDVCYSYSPTNIWLSRLTLSINGKRTNITKDDLTAIANANSIKKADKIIDQIVSVVRKWENYATSVKVREGLKHTIKNNLNALKWEG
jgi:serine/threonine-protein kinase HipA